MCVGARQARSQGVVNKSTESGPPRVKISDLLAKKLDDILVYHSTLRYGDVL